MVWFLALHISSLLVWASALLYLPVMMAGPTTPGPDLDEAPARFDSVARFLFTRVATPVALLAILSGTGVFLIDGNTSPWLIAKLTLVTALVVCHTLVGLLVIRSERGQVKGLRWQGLTLALLIVVLIAAIIWIVLAKPSPDLLPGGLL